MVAITVSFIDELDVESQLQHNHHCHQPIEKAVQAAQQIAADF